jgi:hypothetical protein
MVSAAPGTSIVVYRPGAAAADAAAGISASASADAALAISNSRYGVLNDIRQPHLPVRFGRRNPEAGSGITGPRGLLAAMPRLRVTGG